MKMRSCWIGSGGDGCKTLCAQGKWLLVLLLFVFCVSVQALNLSPYIYRDGDAYQSFRNISFPLGANIVNTVYQDSLGMMWFGTQYGLFNYNGYDLHICTNGDYLYGNSIYAIIQQDENLLCIGTDNGLFWYDMRKERFEDSFQGLTMRQAVRSLALFDGKLWIGTRDEGLYGYDFQSGELSRKPLLRKRETVIYALEVAAGRLFIGAYEHLSCYDPTSGERHFIDLPDEQSRMINSLLWDETEDCVWVGAEGLLFRYDIRRGKLAEQSFLKGVSCKSLALDGKGNLLVGTDNGLYLYNKESAACRLIVHDSRNPHSLCNNIIWDLMCDGENNIWLATDQGVSLAQASAEYHFIHLSELVSVGDGNSFTCLYMDSHNGFWLGGDNGLIHIVAQPDGKPLAKWFRNSGGQSELRHNRIRHIYEDREGLVWIATDGGIARYEPSRDAFVYYDIQSPDGRKNSNWAYGVYEDEAGRLWVAAYLGGLFVVDKKRLMSHDSSRPFTELIRHLDKENGLSDFVYGMVSNGQHTLWVNTQNGLASVDTQTFEVSFKNLFLDCMIYDDQTVWYSLRGTLYRYDTWSGEAKRVFHSSDCRHIYSLVMEDGYLWFTSNLGIACWDVKNESIRTRLDMEGGYQSGMYDTRNNVIWWGETDRLICFNPNRVEKKRRSRQVFVTAVSSNGELLVPGEDYEGSSLRYQRELRLKRAGSIVLELSSCSYQNAERAAFYYRLSDDGSWQALEGNHLPFNGLSGGTYRLQLSGSSPLADKEAVVHTYTITVPYPWYLRWYAWLVYVCVFAAVLYVIIQNIQRKNREAFERREREKSMELSKMKMDFFVDMSHELKTPLSLIIAPLSRLMSEVNNARQKEVLAAIQNNALRLNTLIYKILNFRQLEDEGENTLIRSHVELCALVQGCVRNFSATLEERQIDLTFSATPDEVWLNVDKLKIESVFINLLSNAIKYVPAEGGRIGVTVRKEADNVFVRVSDNGTGIPEDDLPLVFIRFFQGKNKNKHAEGTGIGLYLVKKFTELHNGQVKAWNDNGLTIEVMLPATGGNAVLREEKTEQAGDASAEPASEGVTLLIIDDNAEMVSFLAESLSRQYRCLKAYDGKEGLKVARQQKPDLIVVDQMMPEMNGMEFCKQIRQDTPTSSIPIIMLTAKDTMETELESIKVGIDVFLPKPFDLKKLMLRIAQLLHKKELLEKSVRIETIARPEMKGDADKRTPDEKLLERITSCIEENLNKEEFNVSALADLAGIDSKQLYRKVKQLTGMTPVSYVRKLRMKKAAVLLEQKKFTVSEVMFLVGYTNASHFSKNFSEEFGVTPKQFMNKE